MNRTVAATTVGLLLGSPVLALAADGLQFGPLRAHPALEVRAEHDDNIFLEPSGEDADWVTTIAPSLRLVLPVRRFALELEGGAEIVRHQDFDEEDATNWHAAGSLGAVFPGGLEFELSDRYRETYLEASQEFGAGEDYRVNEAALTVGYQVRDALRLEVAGGLSSLRYGESTDRERDEIRAQADLFWRFRPRTSVFAEAGLTDYDYLSAESGQDGAAVHGALGLAWAATGRSTGTVKAGVQRKSYDTESAAAGIEDVTTWIVAGSLRHVFTRRTAANLEVSRGTLESDFPDNPYYVRTAAEASLTQRLTAKLYGRAGLRYEHDAYPNATTYDTPGDDRGAESGDRDDDAVRAAVALGFDVLDWLNLEAGWQGRRRRSTFDSLEYDANRFTIAVNAAF